jgi:phenylpropionate dioxygenase-like ring-hydroxylating dioxygenase large terminal subunit
MTRAGNYPRNCWWVAATGAEVGEAPLGRWLLDTPVVLFRSHGVASALADRCIHRWAPLSHIAGIDFGYPRPGNPADKPLMFRIAHLTTPITHDRAHYWWVEGQNYGTGSADERAGILEMLEVTFQQDKDMLEAIQVNIQRNLRPREAAEVSLIADRPALHARRIVEQMMAAEAADGQRAALS